MDLLTRFNEFVKDNNLFSVKDKLLLAVSGGVDSVVLCELCKQAGYDFTIAHCNFKLRNEESERDREFVKNLAKKYGAEFFLKDFDTEKYAEQNKVSIQEAARKLRYDWFEELVNAQLSMVNKGDLESVHHSPFIIHLLTAHHADDNIETVLMNFCRGTGLQGLEGIPVTNLYIRRPLLEFWKEELIDFAKENKLEFVEDSSNLSSRYTRNLFRNEILPLISKVYPQVKENLQNNIERFKEIRRLYKISVGEIKKKLLKQKGDEIHIPVKQLIGYQNRALIYEIISGFGFSEKHIDELFKLAESESGKFIQAPNASFRIIKFRNWFIIANDKSLEAETIIIEQGTENIQFSMFNIQFSTLPTSNSTLHRKESFGQTSNSVACLDADEVIFPLILRRWKQGDYFYPLGMRKKKKLARFFIDQKLSKTDREKIWVLEMSKKVIWVVGLRIDDRFKITSKTKKVLRLVVNSGQTG